MSGVFLFVFRGMVAARRSAGAGSTTAPTLVGQLGLSTTALDPGGTVRVASEQWTAVSDSGEEIGEGEEVMVVEADGLTLKVFRAPATDDLSEESVP
jgi:membrane-bound serine protease (ClpP class)